MYHNSWISRTVLIKCFPLKRHSRGGGVAQLIERRTGTPLKQVRFLGAARDFSLRINFQCRLFGVRTSPCVIVYINICSHVKDHIVHVRVRWVMETTKHPVCTVIWVARLCRRWLSRGKATRILDDTVVKLKKKYFARILWARSFPG